MDPKIIQFLYINGAIVVALVLYMLFWRPKRRPSRLKLRERLKGDKTDVPSGWRPWGMQGATHEQQPRTHKTHSGVPEDRAAERQLTVIFQYNGHDFEAYESLGLAAGSSSEDVDQTYKTLIRLQPKDTHDFYRKAYEAIRRNK